jgi:hypothetical protein
MESSSDELEAEAEDSGEATGWAGYEKLGGAVIPRTFRECNVLQQPRLHPAIVDQDGGSLIA